MTSKELLILRTVCGSAMTQLGAAGIGANVSKVNFLTGLDDFMGILPAEGHKLA